MAPLAPAKRRPVPVWLLIVAAVSCALVSAASFTMLDAGAREAHLVFVLMPLTAIPGVILACQGLWRRCASAGAFGIVQMAYWAPYGLVLALTGHGALRQGLLAMVVSIYALASLICLVAVFLMYRRLGRATNVKKESS